MRPRTGSNLSVDQEGDNVNKTVFGNYSRCGPAFVSGLRVRKHDASITRYQHRAFYAKWVPPATLQLAAQTCLLAELFGLPPFSNTCELRLG